MIAFENYPLSEQLREFGTDDGTGPRFHGVEVFERTSYDFNILVTPGRRPGRHVPVQRRRALHAA